MNFVSHPPRLGASGKDKKAGYTVRECSWFRSKGDLLA